MIEQQAVTLDFRCVACGYGAARRHAPERCPMCGGGRWQQHPQRRHSSDLPPSTHVHRRTPADVER